MSYAPLISVLMVAYNSSKFIAMAIESVLCQAYANLELIICDDNSTDDTWIIINSFNDSRIKKFRNQYNIGEYANRNLAIEKAGGEYCIFIDGDDLIYQYGLEVLIGFTKQYSECGMILLRPWDERSIYPLKITPKQFYCFEYLDKGIAAINFTKILFKTCALKEVNGFDNPQIKMGDVYIQYKIASKYPSLIVPDGFTWWRRTNGQASEKLLKNQFLFLNDWLQFVIPFLAKNTELLTENEEEQAFVNLYGNYLRFVAKQLLQLKVKPVVDLIRSHPIPTKYISAIYKRPKRSYFNQFTGDNPLQ